jgi:hypothetical protein
VAGLARHHQLHPADLRPSRFGRRHHQPTGTRRPRRRDERMKVRSPSSTATLRADGVRGFRCSASSRSANAGRRAWVDAQVDPRHQRSTSRTPS